MLRYLLNGHELDAAILKSRVDGAVVQAKSDGSLALAITLERFIVKARNTAHHIQSFLLHEPCPCHDLVSDATRNLTQLFLRSACKDIDTAHQSNIPLTGVKIKNNLRHHWQSPCRGGT